jgi:curli biogenesis system outer membrane secretion channel CsgG
MSIQKTALAITFFTSLGVMAGCATESYQAVAPQKSVAAQTAQVYQGPRHTVMVGKFDNRSQYMRGLFSDGVDRLGGQAKTILMAHLQQTGRFSVLDRDNMDDIAHESALRGETQKLVGAEFAITGNVTEFGRKVTGDHELFGILGDGKKQTAYSKVTLNVVNTRTSEVVFSAQGAGEYALSSREVLGFGSDAGYDSTLNGKVLDLAVREAVDRLVEGLEARQWQIGQ